MIDSNIGNERIRTPDAPLAARLRQIVTIGDRLGLRTAIVVWLTAGIGLALFFGWSFVVAAGLSTLVLTLLPCAAMCALGLCAGSSGKKCSNDPKSNH